MEKRILLSIAFLLAYQYFLFAQHSLCLPVPPPGIDPGRVQKTALPTEATGDVLMSGVPPYYWQRGCGPTSVGMVVGYYDGLGFSDLVNGEASTQTADANDAIANDDHYNDYSLPKDYPPTLLDDKSVLGGAHTSNCIADFMNTSWRSRGLYWGWSYFSDIDNSFNEYVQYINSNYHTTTGNIYNWNSNFWTQYMNEIDNNRPVVLLVDTNGDGGTDHFVAGIGYNNTNSTYAVYNTWDMNVHWYSWQAIASGKNWGIYGYTTFQIEFLIVANASPVEGGGVTGDGYYEAGETVDLEATANPGYVFVNWTESDVEVSTSANYSFMAGSNRTLVANFEEDTPVVPDNLDVSDVILGSTDDECYNALFNITVAGNGNSVEFFSGSYATLIAGNSIHFLYGFHAHPGSYMSAYITETASFCDALPESIVMNNNKSASLPDDGENKAENKEDFLPEKSVKIFPNPTTGQFKIELTSFDKGTSVRILNLSGSIVKTIEVENSKFNIDLSTVRKGIYIVQCNDGETIISKKIVVH
ncbi:MAG: T9SS type A sorting domain-containing protein [Prolixibacteraceae bacterium]|nr:T9SS type A sorting domain-containing protein [Prolixibacteraceae bacterium]